MIADTMKFIIFILAIVILYLLMFHCSNYVLYIRNTDKKESKVVSIPKSGRLKELYDASRNFYGEIFELSYACKNLQNIDRNTPLKTIICPENNVIEKTNINSVEFDWKGSPAVRSIPEK